jgi:hypothetical protein
MCEDSGHEHTGSNRWESRMKLESIASGTMQPILRMKTVSRHFRDRSVAQSAEYVEKSERVEADGSQPIENLRHDQPALGEVIASPAKENRTRPERTISSSAAGGM